MAKNTVPEQGFFEKHKAKIAFAGPSECWVWLGAKRCGGYGQVLARGKKRGAHRESYEAENGEGCAEGLVVRHKCDNPPCVNPDHLEIGTVADNNRDMTDRGRRAKGEDNGSCKLTERDAREIVAIYVPRSPTHNQKALANRFGVSQTQIGKIVRGERWAHIA